MGTEKGIVQQRKKNLLKNEVTNKKLFERDFTLQKKPLWIHINGFVSILILDMKSLHFSIHACVYTYIFSSTRVWPQVSPGILWVTQYPSEQNIQHTAGQTHHVMGKEWLTGEHKEWYWMG